MHDGCAQKSKELSNKLMFAIGDGSEIDEILRDENILEILVNWCIKTKLNNSQQLVEDFSFLTYAISCANYEAANKILDEAAKDLDVLERVLNNKKTIIYLHDKSEECTALEYAKHELNCLNDHDNAEENERKKIAIQCIIDTIESMNADIKRDRGSIIIFNQSSWIAKRYYSKETSGKLLELISNGELNVDAQNDIDNVTALHWAAYYGQTKEIHGLMNAKANVNIRQRDGYTPLHLAAFCNQKEASEILVKHDAEVEAMSEYGETPLHCAARENGFDVARLLINEGANVNAGSAESITLRMGGSFHHHNCTPLHLASKNGHTRMISILLDNNAEINIQDKIGWSALHFAFAHNNMEAVNLLLKKEANPDLKNNAGNTPRELYQIIKDAERRELLDLAAKICESKIEDCISLVDEYIKSNEASHFLNWLEVNNKIDTDLIVKFKSKYFVSVEDLQNDNVTQLTAPHPLNTSEQQEQPIILNGDNSKKNNDNKFLGISPRGWVIIATLVVGAIIGAVALYLLASSTLGAAGAIMTGIVVGRVS